MVNEKLVIEFTGEDCDAVLQMAARMGTTPGAVLIEALSTHSWTLDQQDAGRVFQCVSADGEEVETIQFR